MSFNYSAKKINEMHESALKEIGNIGMGNATRSLTFILDDTIKLDLPVVEFLDIGNLSEFLNGKDEYLVLSAISQITGDISGNVLLLLRKPFLDEIIQKMLPDEPFDADNYSEMQFSAINELCNIFIGSYTSSIATFLDMNLKISLPYVCIDMLGAVMSSIAIEVCEYYDKVLVVNNYIESNYDDSFHMFYLPDEETYNKMIL